MGKNITNAEICKKILDIEKLREDKTKENTKSIRDIEWQIVKALSFLVYNGTKTYKKFPNYHDLVQEGFVGLIKAVQCFNPTLFPNFFVYAARHIKHSVKRAASRFDVVYDPNRKRVLYLETSEDEHLDEHTPETNLLDKEIGKTIDDVLDNMNSRDKEIITRTFGLGNCDPQSLREIGKDLNITHERVRQIKEKILTHLKKSSMIIEINKI